MRIRVAIVLLLLAGCQPTVPAETPAARPVPPPPYLLHLPGIAGERFLDRGMVRGFEEAGFPGPTEIYDWPGINAGLVALTSRTLHDREAQIVADRIVALYRASPGRPIVITAHSAGTGIAVFALERLPADVTIDRLFLMASALSPRYDLSPALAHVATGAYSFHSELDKIVLNAGTTLAGTVDGVKTPAAGWLGFTPPPGADLRQYGKLHQYAYDTRWKAWGNSGSHIGAMARRFARQVLAPLAMGAATQPPLPPVAATATTTSRPAARE